MKIAFNPSTVAALIAPPNNKDITFDLRGRNIFARGVKFCGTDTWRDIKINNVSIGSNILDLRNGSNTTLTNTNGVVTINSTWRPVVDNLTSDSTTSSLSANLGRVLAGLINTLSTNISNLYALRDGSNATGRWRGGLACFDVRDTNYTPHDLNMGLELLFLKNTTNNLKDGGEYNGVFSFRQWASGSDWSGGKAHLLSFTDNGNIWHRTSSGDDSWGTWKKLAYSTDIPTSLKNPHALTISLNGTSQGPYDGSAAKNINITPSSIGAATSGHNHDDRYVKKVGDMPTNAYDLIITPTGLDGEHVIDPGGGIHVKAHTGTPFQLWLHDTSNVWYKKTSNGAWVKMDAGHADIASSATKLQTSRLLWGQPFNGTANVDGTINISGTSGSYNQGIRIHTFTNSALSSIWFRATNTDGYQAGMWGISVDDNGMRFRGNTSKTATSNPIDYMNILHGGNVGIGTTNPSSKLTINGDISLFNVGSIRNLAIGGGIYWNPYVESASDGSDTASITVVRLGVAGGTTLVLSLMNDANDTILFKTNGSARLYHNSYPILTTLNTYVSNNKGYINNTEITLVNNANKWITARTFTIGNTSKNVDGSSNVSWSLSEIGAASSNHNHDNRYVRKWTGVYGGANKFLKLVISEEKGWIRLEVSDSNNSLTAGYGIYMIGWGYHGNNGTDTLFARCLYANDSRYITALKIVRTSRNNYDFYFLFASGSSYPSYTINYSSSVSSIDCTVTAIDTIPTATWTSSLSALQLNASQVDWSGITNKPSAFNPAAHTHTVFKNNLMIKGTNGISDSASIHLGIGDSDTGFKWISDGKCLIYANNSAVGEWTSGGMNWFKNPTVNGNKVWNAGNDGSGSGLDADTVDGIDSSGFLRYYNSNIALSNVNIVNTPSYVWTVSTTGGSIANVTKPSGIDNAWGVIHLHTHIGNYATQLGFGGTTNRMYMRNAYNTSTFGNWQALAFITDIPASLPANGGNSDTVDGYHANGLLTALSNTNNGISITVGGTTKSVSNISVNHANSAGNADTVDGVHANQLCRIYTFNVHNSIIKVGTLISGQAGHVCKLRFNSGIGYNATNTDKTMTVVIRASNGGANSNGFYFEAHSESYRGGAFTTFYLHLTSKTQCELYMAAFNYSGLSIYEISFSNGDSWTNEISVQNALPTSNIFTLPNYQIAYTDYNVTSATKLAKARTIWGQSFDGTANISGTLSGVAHILFSADNTYNIGSNSAASKYIYTYWLGAKSGLKLELGANNSNFGLGLCIDTNLNVGIGTNTPAYKLDVKGDIRATGQIIRNGSSLGWVNGRNGALLRETTSTGYHTLWSLKTTNGSWDFGEYNSSGWNNIPVLNYITDTNFNSGNNTTTYQIKFPLDSGTIALTKNIPTSLKSPYSLTLKANGTTLATYDGSSAKEANFTYANVGAASASHTHTYIVAEDLRAKYPGLILDPQRMKLSFLAASTLGIKNDGSYYDVITVRSYADSTGGSDNALLFSKNSNSLYHTRFAFGSTSSWGSPLLIIDSGNIGSQSVAYASKAGNADTTDGVHIDWSTDYTAGNYLAAWDNAGNCIRPIPKGSTSVGYASKAGSVAWDSITGKPSSFTPSSHTHSWDSITDKLVAGNEFNIVNAGYSDNLAINYLPINNRNSSANISTYIMYNGNRGLASVYAYRFKADGKSCMWKDARNYAPFYSTYNGGFEPILDIKTVSGDWSIGSYDSAGNYLVFAYESDSDYNAGVNGTAWYYINTYGTFSGASRYINHTPGNPLSYMYSTGTGTYDGAIQIREVNEVLNTQSAWGYAPRITFHWGLRHARGFGMRSDGLFAVDDIPIALTSNVLTFNNDNANYLKADFNNPDFSKKAASKYIECWDSAGGWWNWMAGKFMKAGSSDDYVLLGGGGHKLISDFATSNHTHPLYLPLAGGTMTGTIKFNNLININSAIVLDYKYSAGGFARDIVSMKNSVYGDANLGALSILCYPNSTSNGFLYIYLGTDKYDGPNNLRIYKDKVTFGDNILIDAGNIGSLTVDKSYHLRINHNVSTSSTWSTWYWLGQSGQPTWLWGCDDGTNCYVWNPSNFSVKYAASAGNADTIKIWEHESNDAWYYVTWTTLNGTGYGSIYESTANLLYNPSLKTLWTGGGLWASLYVKAASIRLENTNEINSYSGDLYLNHRNTASGSEGHTANIKMCGTGGSVIIGANDVPSYLLDVRGNVIASSWLRTRGNSGWFSESYGGGIYMIDTSWIRTYNGKGFYCDNLIYSSNSIRMGNILLEHTDEINNSANGGLHLNYRNTGNITLCNGGGNVGIGTTSPTLKLYVVGSGYFSDTVYSNTLNHTSLTGHLIIGNKTKEISIRSSDLPDVPAVYLLQKFSTNVYYTANKGFGIRPYYLSSASMNLMETISGNKYTVVKVGDDVLAISCIIADKVPLMSQIKGTLIRFLPGDDGLIVLLKDLNNYGNGNGYLYVLPKNCNIVRSDNSNIFIADGNISSAYDDSKSRFFIYAKTYNVWIEFYCG